MTEEKKNSLPEGNYLGVGEFILEIIKLVVLAFVIIVPIRLFLFQPFFVQGASMEPNFKDGEYLIVNEFGYKTTEIGVGGENLFVVSSFKEVKRQEVVVFRYPLDRKKFFIKRIIGLPGEKIEIDNNQVTIYNQDNPSGFILDEAAYLGKAVRTNGNQVITLEKDEYFVMGDNRLGSSDSRNWGPVKEKYIMGRVLLRAWPPKKLEVF